MTTDTDGTAATENQNGTGDSYKKILATILGQSPQPDDVFGETHIFRSQSSRMAFPVISIDSKRVPLFGQQCDPDTIREVQIRMKGVETGILNEAVTCAQSPSELLTNTRQAIASAIGFRCFVALCYGIPLDDSVPPYRVTEQAIEPGLPHLGRVEIRRDDPIDLVLP